MLWIRATSRLRTARGVMRVSIAARIAGARSIRRGSASRSTVASIANSSAFALWVVKGAPRVHRVPTSRVVDRRRRVRVATTRGDERVASRPVSSSDLALLSPETRTPRRSRRTHTRRIQLAGTLRSRRFVRKRQQPRHLARASPHGYLVEHHGCGAGVAGRQASARDSSDPDSETEKDSGGRTRPVEPVDCRTRAARVDSCRNPSGGGQRDVLCARSAGAVHGRGRIDEARALVNAETRDGRASVSANGWRFYVPGLRASNTQRILQHASLATFRPQTTATPSRLASHQLLDLVAAVHGRVLQHLRAKHIGEPRAPRFEGPAPLGKTSSLERQEPKDVGPSAAADAGAGLRASGGRSAPGWVPPAPCGARGDPQFATITPCIASALPSSPVSE